MSKFSRLDVLVKMKEAGVVPLYYNSDTEICKKVIKACYKGGLQVFEFTNRGEFAHEVFGELVKWAKIELPDLVLGVGSIVEPGTCSLYMQMGAAFIVSPLLNEEMGRICNRRKVAWLPGCATVSEIARAEELGVEVVKAYPAAMLGGPAFVKAIKAPCPWTEVMPSGGVAPTEENLKAWFEAGAFCVGMGSNLVTKKIIENGDYDLLQKNVTDLVALLVKIRT